MPQRPTEGRSSCRGFPVAFRPPALASWTSCPAGGFRPSYDRPTGPKARTPTGFPRSAHSIHDRIGCPLYPETTRCSSGQSCPPDHRAPPLPGARSYHPGHHPIYPELRMTRRHQGFTRVHPPGLLPGPAATGWNSNRLGHHPRASHPTGQEPATHAEAGDGQSSTSPELHHRHCRPPIDAAQSMCATSCRTAQLLLVQADLEMVGSARGAVSMSPPVRFPAPPSEPDVRLVDASGSPQAPSRAMRGLRDTRPG
jgi:hypothetical protein